MFATGLGNFLEDGFDATGWFLVALLQLAVMVAVILPLQRWRPVEPVTDRQAIRTDIVYTLIHRLGLFRVALFFTAEPLFDNFFGALRVWGLPTFHLDDVWPGVTDQAWISFVIYLLVFDWVNYWIHRGQHHFNWWWKLHALHHSQRQMTMWSDNRNHLLDDLLRSSIMVVVAQLIGIAPGQFVAIVALAQLSESFQHANVRMWFGRVGERMWVSPRFHRLHHAIGIGHESHGKNTLGGANFGVLLPWWDMLTGTANFEYRFEPTGVRDQMEQGVDYGRGFWAQQWLGLKRLLAS
jgi:sterol desaturase/sphingolipid hydroxylase (fatty acid hydroxylase superfamily)